MPAFVITVKRGSGYSVNRWFWTLEHDGDTIATGDEGCAWAAAEAAAVTLGFLAPTGKVKHA